MFSYKRERCNQPVLIILSLILTREEELMWSPSVFGLVEGAIILIPDATTRNELVNAMCVL